MSRTLNCQYLYTDGTLVAVYEERKGGVVIGETVDITLGYAKVILSKRTELFFGPKDAVIGRIVLHRGAEGFVTMAKGGTVAATMPTIEAGSENTRKLGIAVQCVTLTTKAGVKLEWSETPSILSSNFHLQEMEQTDPDRLHVGYSWGSGRIWKITDLRAKSVEVTA